ncbi:MAG: hypothetical protein ACLTL6_17205 [Holdemanella porci]
MNLHNIQLFQQEDMSDTGMKLNQKRNIKRNYRRNKNNPNQIGMGC